MSRELEAFAREHVPDGRVTVMPRARGRVHVVRAVDGTGATWYAKHLAARRKFEAELRAYAHWSSMPFVPPLVAVDAGSGFLLVGEAPGLLPARRSVDVLAAAGERLRELHAVDPAPGWPGGWRAALRRDAAYHVRALRDRGEPAPRRLVRRAVRELVRLDGLPLAVTHGDYQASNWRWTEQRGLSVFDFGEAARRPAVHDLTRLRYGACWEAPERFARLLRGYGRSLSEEELRYLELSLVVRAVAGLNLGRLRRRPAMVQRARRVLSDPYVRGLVAP